MEILSHSLTAEFFWKGISLDNLPWNHKTAFLIACDKSSKIAR